MISTKEALRQVPLLSDLNEKELELLSDVSSIRKYSKNDTIIHKEDEGESFFSLLSGRVKIVLDDDEGKEIIVGILHDHEFFGELSLLDGQPRSATVVALEPTETVAIKRKDFLKQLTNNPGMCIKVLAELAGRIRKSNELIGSLAFLDVCGRLARVLLDMAKDQGQEQIDGIKIKVSHSRTELANLVGTTRETLTRALKTLETMGYLRISREKKNIFTITNIDGLTSRIC